MLNWKTTSSSKCVAKWITADVVVAEIQHEASTLAYTFLCR